jgi:hypothetical protein
MEPQETAETKRSGKGFQVLHGVETGFVLARKVAVITALVLMSAWVTGRVVEAIHGQKVFDLHLVYWLGVFTWIAVAVYLAGAAAASVQGIRKAQDKRALVIPWATFLLLAAVILIGLEGFRVASAGLFATLAGSSEPAKQASFLLFKNHPLNPLLPVNLIAANLSGMAPNVQSLASFIWNWNYLLLFLIWSVVYGIVLLIKKTEVWPKAVHLFLATGGLIAVIIMKSFSLPTKGQMVILYAAALLFLIFQILLTYSCLRLAAVRKNKDAPHPGAFQLPPSAVQFALILFVVVPVLTDLQNQFALVHPSTKIMAEISKNQAEIVPKVAAVTSISIHAGPAIGDDIVGVLPGGVRVPVLEKKYKWVRIGKNRWVADKFLAPLKKG